MRKFVQIHRSPHCERRWGVKDDRDKDLFEEEMDDDEDEDPRMEAVMGFVAENLSGFQERIEAVEGGPGYQTTTAGG